MEKVHLILLEKNPNFKIGARKMERGNASRDENELTGAPCFVFIDKFIDKIIDK